MVNCKYLLYIDILGFSELVRTNWKKIDDLYLVIAGLNMHKHDAFKTIIFSDTILVYNDAEPESEHDHEYIVMFMCEFAKDLLHRLAGRDIAFRGVLTWGPFCHYNVQATACFYGQALIDAYLYEKNLSYTGLFMDRCIVHRNKVFSTRQVTETLDYVYITQMLQAVEHLKQFPFPAGLFEDLDYPFLVYPEFLFWKTMRDKAIAHSDIRVRKKCENTAFLLAEEYPSLRDVLYKYDFDLSKISPIDWKVIASRFPEDHSYVTEL